jgi:hypothetical protein
MLTLSLRHAFSPRVLISDVSIDVGSPSPYRFSFFPSGGYIMQPYAIEPAVLKLPCPYDGKQRAEFGSKDTEPAHDNDMKMTRIP